MYSGVKLKTTMSSEAYSPAKRQAAPAARGGGVGKEPAKHPKKKQAQLH